MKPIPILIKWLIPVLLILASCKSEDFNDASKKNENWVWFTPTGSNKGYWKQIDISGEGEVFKDGKCIFFYSNGQKREEFIVDSDGNYDTIFFFNIESILTHYTYTSNGELNNYILKNGEFKAYDPNGNLSLIGTSESNKLIEFQFAGKYLDFYNLIYHQTKSWRNFEKYMKIFSSSILEANNENLEFFPTEKLTELDSIRNEHIISLQKDIEIFKNENFSDEFTDLKTKILELDELILQGYTYYFATIELNLKNQYNEENKLICKNLIKELLEKSEILDDEIESSTKIDKELQISDFYVVYFEKMNEDFQY